MGSIRNDWTPPSQFDAWAETQLLSRRQAIRWGVVAGGALPPPAAVAVNSAAPGVSVESEAAVARPYPNIHGGNGTISVRYFPFDQQPMPAHFVIYEIPPGASEGVHTHHLGDNVQGLTVTSAVCLRGPRVEQRGRQPADLPRRTQPPAQLTANLLRYLVLADEQIGRAHV